MDFHSAFTSAQEKVSAFLAIDCSDEYKKLDEESGLENTGNKDVQLKLRIAIDVDEIVQCYSNSIASSSALKKKCTLDIYNELAADYSMVLATNGMVQTQRKRVSDFCHILIKYIFQKKWGA